MGSAIAGIAALMLFGCANQGGGDKILVGVIAELTGDIPAVGASCKNAAELAVKEINDSGGINAGGRKYPIKLFIEDTTGKTEQSVSAVHRLIMEDDVVAIVGPNASRYAVPASEVAEGAKVLMITPWCTNPKATIDVKTGQPKKYVFRACFEDMFQGRLVAKFALDNLKKKTAAVLYDVASEYNKGQAEYFKKTYEENGGKIVAFETYTANNNDYSAQLVKIKDANPEVIFLPNYYTEVPLQIQLAKRLGITAPFLGSDTWGSSDLLKLCGGDCEGYFFSTHYAADMATTAAKSFINSYTAKYGNPPDDVAALTYDTFGLLTQALQKAGKIDRQAVRDAMAKITDYQGVTGNMQFKEGSGDPIKSAVIVQIKDGKFSFYAFAHP
ncbi:MAG: ABC transporter substrate-binding protein [bacterium]